MGLLINGCEGIRDCDPHIIGLCKRGQRAATNHAIQTWFNHPTHAEPQLWVFLPR